MYCTYCAYVHIKYLYFVKLVEYQENHMCTVDGWGNMQEDELANHIRGGVLLR